MSSKTDLADAGETVLVPLLTPAKIDRNTYPDKARTSQGNIPATYENFKHLLTEAGVVVRFNLVRKRPEIMIPGVSLERQNRDGVVLAHLESLLIRNEMSTGQVTQYLLALADEHAYDPVADWIESKRWDGNSRLPAFCATIVPQADYPHAFRDVLIRKWLLSIVAATFRRPGFRARGVLTLQGAQGLGKTSWIARLVTPQELRDEVVKLGHSWDGGSKDARLTALRHRVVELGELEGSFRKEMASLKAFITEENDKIRPPYARVEAEYPRSTIFAASVNDPQFLLDNTGNSRFWTIPAAQIDHAHAIDMQQVFAELKVAYEKGDQWWLTQAEEQELARINYRHRVVSAIEAKIAEALDLNRLVRTDLPRLTAIQVLHRLGIERPTNPQAKEANVALRNLLGESTRSGGYNRWRVPFREENPSAGVYTNDEEEY